MDNQNTLRFAELGASIRLDAIDSERRAILRQFPRLKYPAVRNGLRTTPGARSRVVSKAARKAMSEGMRKFWARRKAAKK